MKAKTSESVQMLSQDLLIYIRALRSELLSEISSRVSSRNEFLRVGTSSEKARITRPNPNFQKTDHSDLFRLVFCYFFAKNRVFSRKLGSERVGTSRNEFGRLEIFPKYFEIRKTAISETRKNKNFRKKRLTQGLTFWLYFTLNFFRFNDESDLSF